MSGNIPVGNSTEKKSGEGAGATPPQDEILKNYLDETFYSSQITYKVHGSLTEHYLKVGWQQGLDPSPDFCTKSYLRRYPDVRRKNMNPLWHYVNFGKREGRLTEISSRISESAHILSKNDDVGIAIATLLIRLIRPKKSWRTSPNKEGSLSHYLKQGWREFRPQTLGSWTGQVIEIDESKSEISPEEKARIVEAAKVHTSNDHLCAALKAIADPDFYRDWCEAVGIISHDELEVDVVTHYLAIGRHFRVSITPLFSIPHYLEAAEISGIDSIDPAGALIHYLSEGEAAGIRPCAFFSPDYYRRRHDDVTESPLVHYINQGANHDYQPSAAFWSEWYRKANGVKSPNLLAHFYSTGIEEGCTPNPIFSWTWYASVNNLKSREDALRHYAKVGLMSDLAPSPLIHIAHIQRQAIVANVERYRGETSVELYLRLARKIDPHPLFDTTYYLSLYERGGTISQPLADYLTKPQSEDRRPNPYFLDQIYFESRPDVRQSGLNALFHYVSTRGKEKCEFHPLISNTSLVETMQSLDDISPLEALITGVANDKVQLRSIVAQPDTVNRSRWLPVALDIERAADRYPDIGVDGARVGIFAHVFYLDLLSEVIDFASNVPQPSTLFVTTDTDTKRKRIISDLELSDLPSWEVRVCENRGRDIAPSFFGFADRMGALDYGVHIHTKRSRHYGESFDKWRRYLFHENGGSRDRVEAILRVFQANPTLGALAPIDFGPIRKLISWGYDRQMVEALLKLAGRNNLLGDVSLEFPSGSMFWFRAPALRGLYRAGLGRYHFDSEKGQVDGTLAHAIERAFFMLIESEGYDWVRFCSGSRVGGYKVTDDIAFARSRLLPPQETVGPITLQFAETTPFFCRAVDNERPRLNLLIPTCDQRHGYAGVSEAIRQFRAVGERLGPGVDLRVIATEVAFDNMTVPPRDFTVFDSLVEDSDMAVVPGYRRLFEPLGLRRNDRFVVSAWWNAKQAFELIDMQSEIYGHGDKRRMVYLIQDFEPGFYPWSTRWALAENTYRHPERTIAVFNTPILAEFMTSRYSFSKSETYYPMINEELNIPLAEQLTWERREKIVLLYARPHAERNCIEMIDAIVDCCVRESPDFWYGWQFLAIGENFNADLLRSRSIKVLGRLSLQDYRHYLACARLGISLMVSPHPSYPPLEMAANGIRVLVNTYEGKDLSSLHQNIDSFEIFDPQALARQLKSMAERSTTGGPLVSWFFNGGNNVGAVAEAVAHELRCDLGLVASSA